MRDKNTRMQLGDMTAFINSSLNPRGANDKNGERMANYIFTRAHDTEAQTIIQRIIRDRINPNLFGYNFTRDEIKKAFEIYNADINTAHMVTTWPRRRLTLMPSIPFCVPVSSM